MAQAHASNRSLRVLLACLSALLAWLVLISPIGRAANNLTYDLLFYLRGSRQAPTDIVIVSIDERSFAELGKQWPWPREVHGKLLDSLREAGALLVGFDIFFPEPSNSENDSAFAAALDRMDQVVLASNIENLEDAHVGYDAGYQLLEPLPIIDLAQKQVATGVVRFSLEEDGFLRRFEGTHEGHPSFTLALANKSGKKREAILESNTLYGINFIGPVRTIQYVAYYQALDPAQYLPENFFKDKIVLVGFSAVTEVQPNDPVPDHFYVPYSRWSGGLMAGVEVHAHVLENILSDTFLTIFDFERTAVLASMLTVAVGFVLLTVRPIWGFVVFVSLFGIGIATVWYLFLQQRLYLSPVALLLALLFVYLISPLVHYLQARKQRNFIRGAFATYLSPTLVKQLIENPDRLDLGGEERDATVMFLDIAGFTAFSERLSPRQLIELINRNLGAFAEIVLQHNGMIDKYIGDCIMAVWGVPLANPEHPAEACRAAIEMINKLDEMVKAEQQISGVQFSVRVGINSGKVIAGNVGGGQQFNYTVLGDDVNLASRLESINKFYGTKLIVSERTREQLDETFLLREIDTIRVVGQKQPVRIFELFGIANKVDAKFVDFMNRYEDALLLYRMRGWSEAQAVLLKLQEDHPTDLPTAILLKRCEKYSTTPPAADWDGVYQMEQK